MSERERESKGLAHAVTFQCISSSTESKSIMGVGEGEVCCM